MKKLRLGILDHDADVSVSRIAIARAVCLGSSCASCGAEAMPNRVGTGNVLGKQFCHALEEPAKLVLVTGCDSSSKLRRFAPALGGQLALALIVDRCSTACHVSRSAAGAEMGGRNRPDGMEKEKTVSVLFCKS